MDEFKVAVCPRAADPWASCAKSWGRARKSAMSVERRAGVESPTSVTAWEGVDVSAAPLSAAWSTRSAGAESVRYSQATTWRISRSRKSVRDEIVCRGTRAAAPHFAPRPVGSAFTCKTGGGCRESDRVCCRKSYRDRAKTTSVSCGLRPCRSVFERDDTMSNKIVAVTGATGQQGGAVARKLLGGWLEGARADRGTCNKPAAQEP